MKPQLQALIGQALTQLGTTELSQVELPQALLQHAPIERTRDSSHGDYACSVAMALAKPARMAPRKLAELIVAALPADARILKVEIAGPGFINFFLQPAAQFAVIDQVLKEAEHYGQLPVAATADNILLEFVSANPTGPMHVGHGRGAAYGDALANVLAARGHKVTREYYINDAGRQVDVLALSVWLRYLQAGGIELPTFPARGYPAEYVLDCAASIRAEHGERFMRPASVLDGLPDEPQADSHADEAQKRQLKDAQEARLDALIDCAKNHLGEPDYASLRDAALGQQLASIRATLQDFGVSFDVWTSERRIVEQGKAASAITKLEQAGQVYEQDGARWLRTSALGDEKDRVLFKSDGAATYFANDLAYHEDKLERGYNRLLDIWGADHHGYIARMRAAIEALTGRPDALDVQLVQFVSLSTGRMGKRSGNFVTFSELIAQAGRDATRFFYLMQSHDQPLEFDVELAQKSSSDNPVYYVQYAHARLCRVMEQAAERDLRFDPTLIDYARLTEPHEQALATLLTRYPEALDKAASKAAPHHVVYYVRELADALHSYYNAQQFLVDDAVLRNTRLALCLAVRQVLHNALAIVGVGAPETM